MTRATVSADGETITVHIPLTFRKRGGRKVVVTPDGAEWAPRPRVDNAMVKALARAFRWRKTLDTGVYATIDDLANTKGIGKTYVSQVLRLTLLAPEMVDAILDGRQPAELQLDDLLAGFPLEWVGQRTAIAGSRANTLVSPMSGESDSPERRQEHPSLARRTLGLASAVGAAPDGRYNAFPASSTAPRSHDGKSVYATRR